MINTVNTKEHQLKNGYFEIGNGSDVVLIIGSCRSVPYINYFKAWNDIIQERFKIIFIDPYNWHFDLQDNRTNFEDVINKLEKDERILSMLKSVKWYIHEYFAHYGMFCCDKGADKNIYQFSLNPEIDICIPNFNDIFIMFADIVTFDSEIRKKATADYNVLNKLSYQTQLQIFELSESNLNKFYSVCEKSDLPEMKDYFKHYFKDERMFWTYNHVSKKFTLKVFDLMVWKYLSLYQSDEFKLAIQNMEDMFANNYTKLTNYDLIWRDYKWDEPVIELRSKL